MNAKIIPAPAANKKSRTKGQTQPATAEADRILDGWLEETAQAILALQRLQAQLKSWRAPTCQIRPEDVDGVQDILRHANLDDWAADG